jgi:hypothetical protein
MNTESEMEKYRKLKEDLEESIITFNKLYQELKEVEAEIEKYRKLKKIEKRGKNLRLLTNHTKN